MTSDFLIEPGRSFGEWLRSEIEEAAFVEQNGYFPDQARRIAARLQAGVSPADRLEVLVPWIRIRGAFTAPGRYIYLSRGLQERCPTDECVAFVVAHEIAHHQLGHLGRFRGGFARRAARMGAGTLLILFFRFLQKRIYSPEWECAADRRAIDLCVAAGYDAQKCLHVFHIMELIALDAGDLDGVYGLDPESDEELAPDADFLTKARLWLWQRRRGYLPLQDRAAEVRRYFDKVIAAASA